METPLPSQTQKADPTLTRLSRDIRLGCYFDRFNGDFSKNTDENNIDYDPKLYVKDTSWTPLPSNDKIDARFNLFSKTLRKHHHSLPTKKNFNVTPHENYLIKTLAARTDLIEGSTDKNCGPFIRPRPNYIRDCLNGHILKTQYYKLLSEAELHSHLKSMQTKLADLYSTHRAILPEQHQKYFDRSFALIDASPKRIAQFYGLYKVHKKELAVRPVISCCGTYAQIYSKYIDHWLKKIVHSILPTYLKNADTLIEELGTKFPSKLPASARLFSIDAIGMYSNIDTDHGITVARNFFEKFADRLPEDCPTAFVLDALELIMRNNIFQFGDTNWLQLIGCAMGTSAAVNYAYIYIGLLEMTELIDDFKAHLLFYRRYIDDGLGIWNCGIPNSAEQFKLFLARLNNWGKLRWTCTGFVSSVVFLDLTISIRDRHLHYQTYQKEHNLYLYIPPLSAHPKEMIRGLIFGRLRTYYKHNTDYTDYCNMAFLLAQRLLERGWTWNTIKPIFNDAHNRITGLVPAPSRPYRGQPLFIHTVYHPRGLQRQDLRHIFNQHLGDQIPNQLIIAMSRPKNLKDRLIHSTLPPVTGCNPSDFLDD